MDALNFASKLDVLEERWNHFEMFRKGMVSSEANSAEPEFYSWFVSEKSSIVSGNMIPSIRKTAHLGEPPEKLYESIYNVLKLKV